MNKLFKTLAASVLGIALAAGVGIGIASGNISNEVKADKTTTESVTLSNGTYNTTDKCIEWNLGKGIVIKQLKGSSSTAINTSYISAPRVYKGHVLSFTASTGYKINSISLTVSSTYYGNSMTAGTVMSGTSVTDNTTDVSRTWTTTSGGNHVVGSVAAAGLSQIYIQNVASASNIQLRFTALSITYTSSLTEYTVSFNANGGSGTMDDVKSVASYTLPACTFTAPSSKTFIGWKVENAGEIYAVGSEITLSADTTLYAQWSTSYTVTFDPNGGTGSMEPVVTSASYVIPASTFTAPEDKAFASWNTASDGTGTTYNVGDNVTLTEDLDLFAIWGAKPLESTYDFETNFATYASEWPTGYGERKGIKGVDDLCGDYAANVDLYYASKQSGTITNLPVFATKTTSGSWTKVLDFKLTEENFSITSVSATFVQWTTKTPDIALFAGSEVSGTPIASITIGSDSLKLEGTLNSKEFCIGYCDKSTSNQQSALKSIYVSLRSTEVDTYSAIFLGEALCDGGVTAPSTSLWSDLADTFDLLSADDKALLKTGTANTSGIVSEQCLARYDLIVSKYGKTTYEDYMNRDPQPVSSSLFASNSIDNNTMLIVIVAVAITSVTLLGVTIFLKKKRTTH